MFRQARQLPRLDLTAHRLQALSLTLTTEWDDDLADTLGWGDVVSELFGLAGGEEPPLVISYRKHKVKYVITILANPAGTDDENLAILLRFAVAPVEAQAFASILPNEREREADILGQLLQIELTEPIQVAAELDFGQVPKTALWYPLPQRMGEPPASPLFELRGVRGARLDASGEREDYEFTLDRSRDNDAVVYIEFKDDEPFNLYAPERALERTNAIARELVDVK